MFETSWMTTPRDPSRHGDYEPTGRGQEVRLVEPATCHRGHPIVNSSGFTPCPRCETPTNVWWCAEKDCDGRRTSRAHERDCPRQEAQSNPANPPGHRDPSGTGSSGPTSTSGISDVAALGWE